MNEPFGYESFRKKETRKMIAGKQVIIFIKIDFIYEKMVNILN